MSIYVLIITVAAHGVITQRYFHGWSRVGYVTLQQCLDDQKIMEKWQAKRGVTVFMRCDEERFQ